MSKILSEPELRYMLYLIRENLTGCESAKEQILASYRAIQKALREWIDEAEKNECAAITLQRERDDYKRKYDLVSDDADYRQCCDLRAQAEKERDQLKRKYTKEIMRRNVEILGLKRQAEDVLSRQNILDLLKQRAR